MTTKYKTNYYEDVVTRVNPETGEVQTQETVKKFKVGYCNPNAFVMCYLTSVGILYTLKPDLLLKTFHWLCMHVMIGTNQISLGKTLKKQLCKDLGYSTVTMYKHLKALKEFTFENEQGKSEHIILTEGDLLTLNSRFDWRGDLKKLSEFEIEFKAKFVD